MDSAVNDHMTKGQHRSSGELLKLLEAAEEMAGVGHWHLDTDTEELHWSDEVFRIHGYQPGSFIPRVQQAIEAYHPADRDRISQAVAKGIEEGCPWNEELRLIRADGVIRNVLAKGEPLYEQGQLIALFGVFQDITEQKQQQQHLKQLSQVVELTQEGIIIADRTGRITWVNRGFEQMTGYSLDEVKGCKPGEVLQGPDTDLDTHRYMGEMIRKREPFTAEILNYHKNGQKYWLKVNIYPQFDDNGELQAFMAVETDISAPKLAQTQLEQQASELRSEIQRREKLEQELRAMAYQDSLTGLYNRRYFFEQFATEISRSQRYATPLSLILLDIDYFKVINDSHGHDAGDWVLAEVAQVLQQEVRESDLVARVGGEEFAILATETDLQASEGLAERIRRSLADNRMHFEKVELSVTASFGITPVGSQNDSSSDAYRRADAALYQAKRSGRNRICRSAD